MFALSALQNVVRKLKEKFNGDFNELYETKGQCLQRIQAWLRELDDTEAEGGKGTHFDMARFQWHPSENPELDLPPKPIKKEEQVGAISSGPFAR